MSTATTNAEVQTSRRMTAGQLPANATWGVLAASLAVGALLVTLLGSFSYTGTVLLGGLVFLITMFALSMSVEGIRKAKDRLATHLVTGAFLLALVPLVSLVISTIGKGLARLDAQFFTYSMRNVVGEGGGAIHAIYGTLIVTGLAALISLPIGIFTAIYLVEYGYGRRLARSITFFVDVMTGIPSIVAGLFTYALIALIVGPGTKMGLAGAIALSVLMIPTVVRSTEEMLRLVPNDLRESSYALGVPKWKTISKIVLPTSIAGIITGAILAVARVIGETAPLLVTAGLTASMNTNPVEGPMTTLPVYVYYQYMTPGIPQEPFYDRAWTGALTLVAIVMVLNLIGRLLAWKFAPKGNR
ncbi:phosphate ABC transporter permease PstA [Luteococcus sp. Sow4_B9]|uniref:phosphate ABC transporter permease PstA n=1 Tax=Luteococcus sp. Sow4_B9 TaxID=3438792 RepID=UPI003F9C5B71